MTPKETPKTKPFVVTIDGPAASGKTTVSRRVANLLDWSWVSTGAFYRGLALVAQKEGLDFSDELALAGLAKDRRIWHIEMRPENTEVVYKGKVVTPEIRQESLGSLASEISKLPKVRQALLQPQRNCALGLPGLIAEGRDCGTVVFPDAHLKFFLTAEGGLRAKRRAREDGASKEEILAQQKERDERDSTREVAPLQSAEGAIVIDSSELEFNQVVELIVKKVNLMQSQ